MDLGNMKDRVTFRTATVTKNSGGNVGSYADVLTTWAEVKEIDQTRALQFGLVDSYKNFEINIRYRSDIAIKREMLALYKGITLTIHSVIEDRQKSFKIIAYTNA